MILVEDNGRGFPMTDGGAFREAVQMPRPSLGMRERCRGRGLTENRFLRQDLVALFTFMRPLS